MNTGTCNYCDEDNQIVRGTPYMADIPAKMCEHCWNMTRKEYLASEGTDIGEFDKGLTN